MIQAIQAKIARMMIVQDHKHRFPFDDPGRSSAKTLKDTK